MQTSISLVQQCSGSLAACLPSLCAAVMPGHTLSATLAQCCSIRACSNKSLRGGGTKASGTSTVPTMKQQQRAGNVYPTLTQAQLDVMRQRRLTSNCAPSQLMQKQPAAHQAKHIMMCSGSSCTSSCQPCGATGESNGDRCWEYLAHRLQELNQLRSEEDEQTPFLVSRLNCLQAQNLLPALASTLPCHGPIAVVYPEGVWYDRLTPLVLERIIEEHLLGGHTVSAHVMIGSRAPDHGPHVLPALDITRRADTDGHWACNYAY